MTCYVISTINHRIQPLVRQLNAILGVKLGFKVHAGGSLSCTGEVRLLIFWCFIFHQKYCSKFKSQKFGFSMLSEQS